MTDYYRFDTPVGTLIAWSNGKTDAQHAHVGIRTEHEHNRYGRGPVNGGWEGVAASITLSRVAYTMSEHYAYDTVRGMLVASSYTGYNPLTRASRFSLEKGTAAAIKAYQKEVEPALVAFLATDEGREMLATGEAERVQQERDRLTREIEVLESELKIKRAALRKLPKEES